MTAAVGLSEEKKMTRFCQEKSRDTLKLSIPAKERLPAKTFLNAGSPRNHNG